MDAAGNRDGSPAATSFTISAAPAGPDPGTQPPPAPPAMASMPVLARPPGGKLRVARNGRVKLRFSCPATAASCDAAALRLSIRVGGRTVRVRVALGVLAPGERRSVAARLPAAARTALKRAGKRGLQARLEGGGQDVRLVLKPAR